MAGRVDGSEGTVSRLLHRATGHQSWGRAWVVGTGRRRHQGGGCKGRRGRASMPPSVLGGLAVRHAHHHGGAAAKAGLRRHDEARGGGARRGRARGRRRGCKGGRGQDSRVLCLMPLLLLQSVKAATHFSPTIKEQLTLQAHAGRRRRVQAGGAGGASAGGGGGLAGEQLGGAGGGCRRLGGGLGGRRAEELQGWRLTKAVEDGPNALLELPRPAPHPAAGPHPRDHRRHGRKLGTGHLVWRVGGGARRTGRPGGLAGGLAGGQGERKAVQNACTALRHADL